MRHRPVAAAVAAILVSAAAAGDPPPTPTVTCTNPFSGATWPIAIDYAHATVDAYPARITDDTIAWHDLRDGGRYRLDRASGALTVVVPSSTGGYFLHDHCRLEK